MEEMMDYNKTYGHLACQNKNVIVLFAANTLKANEDVKSKQF